MTQPIKKEGKFNYIETGKTGSETILLLHGLMGGLSNFGDVITHFSKNYNVVMPTLPIYEMPMLSVSLDGLLTFLEEFVDYKGFERVHLIGNSLGGHIALLYVLKNPNRVASMTLTGSSGLYESAMGNTFPKRGDYEFIKRKTQDTFYSPESASQELIDEIFNTVNDRGKALRIVMMSKSAIRHNLGDELHQIKAPTLLIWGKNDIVTPPEVGERFHELIDTSKLVWIDECGHAPMMEHPQKFNEILEEFLNEVTSETVA
ncbi:MAG: alpha/beta hydrolase [Saprospiraceae bacterium]|nr:alpha/beta hydrolase [Saprospiraceae bacterium]